LELLVFSFTRSLGVQCEESATLLCTSWRTSCEEHSSHKISCLLKFLILHSDIVGIGNNSLQVPADVPIGLIWYMSRASFPLCTFLLPLLTSSTSTPSRQHLSISSSYRTWGASFQPPFLLFSNKREHTQRDIFSCLCFGILFFSYC
jgi:hypothetical protein